MAADVLCANGDFDLLLAAIGEAAFSQQADRTNEGPISKDSSAVSIGDEEPAYDLSQPPKSWWRYFLKRADNTALCYTCNAVFNRGAKQSTTSLSHHLKQYHREQYIAIQQAKDEDLRRSSRTAPDSSGTESRPSSETPAAAEKPTGKKSAVSCALISAVRARPPLFDATKRTGREDELQALWTEVAEEVGAGLSADTTKKRWLQMRDRYKKELKFAIRDGWSYSPKWPFFSGLSFLQESVIGVAVKKSDEGKKNEGKSLGRLGDEGVANALLSNFLSAACSRSPVFLDEEAASSTDSATASLSDRGSTPSNPTANGEGGQPAENSALIAIQQLLNPPQKEETAEPPAKRARSRKAPPARVPPPSVSQIAERFDWMQDENLLFGKIIAYRLRGLPPADNKKIKIMIDQLFERHERGLPLPDFNL